MATSTEKKKCANEICMRLVRTSGLCNRHYLRWNRHGNAEQPSQRDERPAVIEGDIAKIPLGVGAQCGYAIVDKKFAYLAMYKWTLDHGYARAKIDGRIRYMQHLIKNDPPAGMVTDHEDRDRLNNREVNLVFKTQSGNAWNASMRSDNSSGYPGVNFDRSRGKWRVTFGNKAIGRFTTIEEAVRVRHELEIRKLGRLKEVLDGNW